MTFSISRAHVLNIYKYIREKAVQPKAHYYIPTYIVLVVASNIKGLGRYFWCSWKGSAPANSIICHHRHRRVNDIFRMFGMFGDDIYCYDILYRIFSFGNANIFPIYFSISRVNYYSVLLE